MLDAVGGDTSIERSGSGETALPGLLVELPALRDGVTEQHHIIRTLVGGLDDAAMACQPLWLAGARPWRHAGKAERAGKGRRGKHATGADLSGQALGGARMVRADGGDK